MTSIEKPLEQRCSFCRTDGTCDRVAFRLEICGLAKLVNAIDGANMECICPEGAVHAWCPVHGQPDDGYGEDNWDREVSV